MSQSAVSRVRRAFALAPHRTEGFKLSADLHSADSVCNIVGLYLHPLEGALVLLCVHNRPSVQARTDTTPAFTMYRWQLERRTHNYIRHGTTDLFAALNIKAGTGTGTVIPEAHQRHRSVEFRQLLWTVEHATPAEFASYLVVDNASAHKTPII